MNIAIICDVLGSENNGTTIAAMNLIRSLKAKGHDVRVVCPDENRRGQEGYYIVPKINLGKFLNNYVAKNGVVIAKTDEEIIRAAVTGCDVVHIMIPFALGHAALKLARERGIPVTAGFHAQAENITSHLFLKDARLINRLTYRVYKASIYKYCDAVHYPTAFIRKVFEDVAGPTNGYVISNGVNKRFVRRRVEKPEELRDRTLILFTGRYSKEKSHKVLIDAVCKSAYRDSIQLIFAGAGPLEEKLRAYCQKKLRIQPRFGFFSRDELVSILNYADLYVHPAEIEIEAIACLEAIACGLVPVIADSERCATKAFALDEKNLFRNKNSSDLAKKMDYWISHPEEKEKRSLEYLDYAKQFDQDECMNRMEDMLRETAEKRGDVYEKRQDSEKSLL